MKNIKLFLFITSIALLPQLLSAQTWLEIGARAQYGATALYEANITDNANHSMQINTGYSYGPTINMTFGFNNGIAFEALFANSTQIYDYEINGNNNTVENEINWRSTDLYLLYRLMNQGAYLEFGPKLSLISAVDQTLDGEPILNGITDVANNYTDQNLAAVLGFGMYLAGSNHFSLSLGFRLEYSFTNFVSDAGRVENFPLPYEAGFETDNLQNFNAFGALELRIPLGGTARAGCGQRRFMIGGG